MIWLGLYLLLGFIACVVVGLLDRGEINTDNDEEVKGLLLIFTFWPLVAVLGGLYLLLCKGLPIAINKTIQWLKNANAPK